MRIVVRIIRFSDSLDWILINYLIKIETKVKVVLRELSIKHLLKNLTITLTNNKNQIKFNCLSLVNFNNRINSNMIHFNKL